MLPKVLLLLSLVSLPHTSTFEISSNKPFGPSGIFSMAGPDGIVEVRLDARRMN